MKQKGVAEGVWLDTMRGVGRAQLKQLAKDQAAEGLVLSWTVSADKLTKIIDCRYLSKGIDLIIVPRSNKTELSALQDAPSLLSS